MCDLLGVNSRALFEVKLVELLALNFTIELEQALECSIVSTSYLPDIRLGQDLSLLGEYARLVLL